MSDSEDDIDDLLLDTVGKSSKKSSNTRARARDFTPSDSSEQESDAGVGFINPYPLEGKYKDKDDRNRVLAMSEIERETLLYDRDREVQELVEKERLTARLRERNAQQAADVQRSAARRSEREATTPKLSAIQELKRKREAKTNKAQGKDASSTSKRSRRDIYSSDDEQDEDDELQREDGMYSDDEIDSPATRRAAERLSRGIDKDESSLEGSKDITYEDALQIRMSRKSCMRFMYYPQFAETAVDCFVRIPIGTEQGKSVYRVCQVTAMQSSGRTYKLPNGELCKRSLECSHGSSVRTFEFTFLSDSPFTADEYNRWCEAMQKDNMRKMNKRTMNRKLTALGEMGQHNLTDFEINSMIEEKRKLSKIPPNVAAEKIRLTGLITEARDNRDAARVEELQNELAKIEELTANRGRNGDLDRLSKLNERNRQQNLKSIGKAESENADKRRQAERSGAAGGGDPFSRLKTKPRMFYESTPTSSAPGSPALKPIVSGDDSSKHLPAARSKKLGGVDSLIGDIQLDLDL